MQFGRTPAPGASLIWLAATVKTENPNHQIEISDYHHSFLRYTKWASVVILLSQVGDQIFAHHPAQSILQFHRLNEQIVLRVKSRRGHRRLEVKAQPLLNSAHPGALRQVQKQYQIQNDG